MRVSLRCSRSMKLGIHSAPDRVSTGSTAGASSSTRPRDRVVDHQRDEPLDGVARRVADISVDIARVQTSS